jgi:protein-tyrosine phosphatase
MTKNKKTTTRIVIVAIAVLTCAGLARSLYGNRWKVWPKRFAMVEQGWLYRGGQIDAGLIEELVDKYKIEGILALTRLRSHKPDEAAELALVRERNLDLGLVPMPGDGVAAFDRLDQAADWIAVHQGHPVLIHCTAGVNRTGAAIAAYRMKHCGWTPQKALAEARRFGMHDRDGELTTHLTKYYGEHLSQSARSAQADGAG